MARTALLLPALLQLCALFHSGTAASVSGAVCDYSQFGAVNAMMMYPNFQCYPERFDVTEKEKKAILVTHNKMRMKAAMGFEERGSPGPQPSAANMKELTWDDQLAELAQAWANQCSFSHDDYASRQTCKHSAIGQNLLIKDVTGMETSEAIDWPLTVHEWYSEVAFHPNSWVQQFTSLHNGEDATGHYTQVVWGDTDKIGCGAVRFDNQALFVCNYAAEGNLKDQAVYQEGKPASACTAGPSNFYPGLCK